MSFILSRPTLNPDASSFEITLHHAVPRIREHALQLPDSIVKFLVCEVTVEIGNP